MAIDVRERIREVKARGDDPVAKMKLRHHCELITFSAILTVLATYIVFHVWTHIGGVLPIAPSFLQEFHDWVYKL